MKIKISYLLGVIFLSIFFALNANAQLISNLKLGSKSEDVKLLQVLLNKDKETQVAAFGSGSKGYENSYFGTRTKNAVIKFQKKYASEILYPYGISFPTGVVGTATREKLNKLYFNTNGKIIKNNIEVGTAPRINSASTNIIKNLEPVTIYGESFTKNGNSLVVASDSDKSAGIYDSSDGKSISIYLTPGIVEKIKSQISFYKNKPQYQNILSAVINNLTGETIAEADGVKYARVIIVIKNTNGESNPFTFKIDIKSLLQ
jgi:WD40 repeat protein